MVLRGRKATDLRWTPLGSPRSVSLHLPFIQFASLDHFASALRHAGGGILLRNAVAVKHFLQKGT